MAAKLYAIPYGHRDGTTAALLSHQRELMLPVQHGFFIIVHGKEGCVEGSFFSHCLFTLEHGQRDIWKVLFWAIVSGQTSYI